MLSPACGIIAGRDGAAQEGLVMTIVGKRLTVKEFEDLERQGILGEDDRVELIHGEIVTMAPVGGEHVEGLGLLTRSVGRQIDDDYLILVQSPIRLSNDGEPMPDLAIVRDRPYGKQLPSEADVLVIFEVSDTTLRYDRMTKLPLYAAAGIPEVWIVNLRARQIERYTVPQGDQYTEDAVAGRGQTLDSVILPELTIAVSSILRWS
jgi:Uma2 family endonuclease